MASSTRRWSVWLHRLIPLVALAVFAVAIGFLVRVFGKYGLDEIWRAMSAIPAKDLALALAFTIASYLVLCTYDLMALSYVGRRLPARSALFTAFTAFAFSNNIGFATLAGSSIRFRLYMGYGLKAGDVVKLIAFVTLTFWVGFLTIAGVALFMGPIPLPGEFQFSEELAAIVGTGSLALAAIYVVLCRFFHRPLFVKGQLIRLPRSSLALAQAFTAAFDWMLAAAVLYLLLPHEHIGYLAFLSIFVSAQVIALVTHVPGGVGVLEALVIYFMSTDHEPTPAVLGGLLVYRIVYYVGPLIVAAVLFAAHEISNRRGSRLASP